MRYPLESLYNDVAQIQHARSKLFGSGRLIGRNLVLTARHVLTEEGQSTPLSEGWQVRLIGTRPDLSSGEWRWIRADIAWIGDGKLDLALLWLIPADPTICFTPKLKLRIARIKRVGHYLARGLGFPHGAKIDKRRVLFVPSGQLSDETGLTLNFGVDQAYQPDVPTLDWRGFSGASVVMEESDKLDEVWVFGVAQHVPPNFTRQLAVARLESAFDNESFRRVLKSADVNLIPPADPYLHGAQMVRWPSGFDFTAYINERRQHFSSREWLYAKTNQWLEKEDPRALLVSADYGVGKTAFVSQLLHLAQTGGAGLHARVVAWHFCRHDLSASLNPSLFVSSITAQLAIHLPDYRASLEAEPKLLEQLDKAGEDPIDAFEAVVLNPLAKLPPPAQRALILIDALDEALEYGSSPNIIILLSNQVSMFPNWLRILATTRNNPGVIELIEGFGAERINAEENDNLDDIYSYVVERCQKEPLAGMLKAVGKAKEEIAKTLRDHSGGKFLGSVALTTSLS